MSDLSVLHILDHSLPLISGYSIRSRDILVAQKAQRLRVAALTGARHRAVGPPVEMLDGVVHYRHPTTEIGRRGPGILNLWREVRALADHIVRIARAVQPHVLHAHSPALNGLAAAIAARRLGLPLVYEVRAFWEDAAVANGQTQAGSLRYWFTRALESYVLRRADGVVAICDGLAQDIAARGIADKKLQIVPNGTGRHLPCDPHDQRMIAQELGLGNADVLAFIGSFYAYEGVADLIAAMPLIVAAHPKAALVLVGGGPEAGRLRAAAAASPVADRIHILSAVPPEAVGRYYALATLLVYPRRALRLTHCVTPLKPLEALGMGKAVALSDVGGHRDLVKNDKIAFFFPAANPAALADAIIAALGDPAERNRRASGGQAYVAAHHDWRQLVRRYDPVYHRLATSSA